MTKKKTPNRKVKNPHAKRKPPAKASPPKLPHFVLPAFKVEAMAAVNDVRYYLNYPFLERSKGKPVLVSTNGHSLLAVEVTLVGDFPEGPLPIEALTRTRKDAGKFEDAVLFCDGNMVGNRKVMFERPAYDFKYPDWRKVIPPYDRDAKGDICLKPKLMTTMAAALGISDKAGMVFVTQKKLPTKRSKYGPGDPTKAVAVRAATVNAIGVKYHAIIMPMRE